MMTIKQIEVTVGEITKGYVNNDELGVRGYNGRLDIRPPYQREFIYNEKEQQAVITTVLNGYPLNVMYWVKRSEDADCPYEVMDGQQRTLSLCEYVDGKFSYDFKNFFNQPEDIQKKLFKEMTTTKGHNGSGLGLFMSYSTIKGHFKGELSFETAEDKGSIFYIKLPQD